MRCLVLLLCLLSIFGCNNFEGLIEIENSTALIPEGIAVDGKTGKIYLSSIRQSKIFEYDPVEKVLNDVIGSGQYGYKRGIGIEIKGDKLFALGSEEVNGKSSSILLVLGLNSRALLHSYEMQDTAGQFMNDLAITASNDIYITDTKRHCVYHLAYPEGQLELFLQHEQIQHPNGITVSDDGGRLFVDSWTEGIRIVDLATKEILNPRHEATAGVGIDGLKYYAGSLYAITNASRNKEEHGLIQIQVNPEANKLGLTRPILVNHPKMNIPTTFSIANGVITVLANSQLDNLDQEKNVIIDPAKLTNTFVIRREIPKQ